MFLGILQLPMERSTLKKTIWMRKLPPERLFEFGNEIVMMFAKAMKFWCYALHDIFYWYIFLNFLMNFCDCLLMFSPSHSISYSYFLDSFHYRCHMSSNDIELVTFATNRCKVTNLPNDEKETILSDINQNKLLRSVHPSTSCLFSEINSLNIVNGNFDVQVEDKFEWQPLRSLDSDNRNWLRNEKRSSIELSSGSSAGFCPKLLLYLLLPTSEARLKEPEADTESSSPGSVCA